ncbi:PepSY-associated TM helix domain-containing protein [Thalassolituus alkanivorans]|uniref:PepSY-associated TM helix domain-containing protein n=1 Tax=Thalassolituus alkanivorans TaxID=2881055 RepID=UPI001E4D6A3C|nr:PepSY domain-containing protein [Thalassolituus alkanivorans]MCB2388146.1 PepSY domain-containing protein [Thalassolituus alkanivorans]MCB2424685.1 PepSY domain-containing protein [Thalassolituus alkanivorans]
MMNHNLYRKIWRWHFYAGLFVLPFMLILALSGIAMLLQPQLEQWQFGDYLTVSPSAQKLSADDQYQAVKTAFPDAAIEQYLPARTPHSSARFHIREGNSSRIVFVDPYRASIIGSMALADTWYAIADDIHGTLLAGWFGDALLEASAGLCIFLLISGLYLHWPRSRKSSLWHIPLQLNNKRSRWRQLHGALGLWLSLLLVFFALSGLAWSGVWGQKIVQPWGSFPAEKSARFWQPEKNSAVNPHAGHHSSMADTATLNSGNLNEISWSAEQLPIPIAEPAAAHPLTAQQIINIGKQLLPGYFRISFPRGEQGVYTLIASTSSGDITDPMQDRTVHINPADGRVLADIGWDNYNLLAKSMAAGIALHKGQAGLWNLWLNIIACLLLMLLALAGLVLWWKRRSPSKGSLLRPPAADKTLNPLWLLLLISFALLFPLSGLALLGFALLDFALPDRLTGNLTTATQLNS